MGTTLCDVQRGLDQLRDEVARLGSLLHQRSERCLIMIDNTNLSQTIKKVDTTGLYRIDYVKLRDFLSAGRLLRQARIYYSDRPEAAPMSAEERTKRQQREDFYSFLRWQGFYLKECRQVERDGVLVEKGLDGAVIQDIERACRDDRIDTVILVAGDMDYLGVVEDVQKTYYTKVEVAFFPAFTARELMSKSGKFTDLWAAKNVIARRPDVR